MNPRVYLSILEKPPPFNLFLSKFLKPNSIHNGIKHASYSTRPLHLMEMPIIAHPTIFNIIQNRFSLTSNLSRIDPDFTYSKFMNGATQAVISISNLISRKEFDSLKGLVHEASIEEIRRNYELLSAEQKATSVAIQFKFIRIKFVYSFEILNSSNSTILVKIRTLFLIDPTYEKILAHDHYAAEYRFLREYNGEGKSSSDWMVTELNHFRSDEEPKKKRWS